MGFLRRFLSLGSKKNKKQSLQIIHNVPLNSNNQLVPEDSESAVNRLLRSSSARYRVVEEVDYNSLPPIPHPINNVVNTPTASTTSLVSTSISQRGTFSAKVHKRECHTPAQLEDIRSSFETPADKDTSHLLRLRSDPSVASLLDMYDEHGRLAAEAFSNSPPSPHKQGRAQTRRSGSTLRQLLGNPTTGESSESDISWAEKYLRESDTTSSTSSLALQTPNNLDDHFPDDPLINAPNDLSFTSDYDLSNTPAISSMEVELSMSSNVSFEASIEKTLPDTYKTPRRASEVFDFLTNKRRSQGIDSEPPLPELPAKESPPPSSSRFSPDSACEIPAIPTSHNDTLPQSPDSSNEFDPSLDESVVIHEGAQARKVKIIMTNPTTVMVTAPTPGTNIGSHVNLPPSRIPRGPRAQMRKVSYGNLKERRPTAPNADPFTPMPSRRRRSRPRIISPTPSENDPPLTAKPREKVRRVSKEKARLHVKPEIPLTPIRTNTSRSPLYRSAVDPGFYQPPMATAPSPASSSEMSPVGQRMMMDARRNKARQRRKNLQTDI